MYTLIYRDTGGLMADRSYEDLEGVLDHIYNHDGWADREALLKGIRRWSSKARPGHVFCTHQSAIVRAPDRASP